MNIKHLVELSNKGSANGIFADFVAKFGVNDLVAKVVFAESVNCSEEDFIYHLCELLMED